MKRCPTCHREYPDTVNFCGEDGTKLISFFSIPYGEATDYPDEAADKRTGPETPETDPFFDNIPPKTERRLERTPLFEQSFPEPEPPPTRKTPDYSFADPEPADSASNEPDPVANRPDEKRVPGPISHTPSEPRSAAIPPTKRISTERREFSRRRIPGGIGSDPVFSAPEKRSKQKVSPIFLAIFGVGAVLILFALGYAQGWWFGSTPVAPDSSLVSQQEDSLALLSGLVPADSTGLDEEMQIDSDSTAIEDEVNESEEEEIVAEPDSIVVNPPPPPEPVRELSPETAIALKEFNRSTDRYNALKTQYVDAGLTPEQRSELVVYLNRLERLAREILADEPPTSEATRVQELLQTFVSDKQRFEQ